MDEEQINALAAALDPAAEAPAQAPQAAPEPEGAAETDGGDPAGEPLEGVDAGDPAEPEAQRDEGDETPEGVEKLTVLGPDGEPKQMKLDEILAETMVDVEVNGETLQVNYEDLRKGYMLQEDYSRKTQEVAKTREEIAPYAEMVAFAKTDPQFVQYMQAYFVNQGDPVAGLSSHPDVTDEQLSQMLGSSDPDTAAQARDIARERAEVSARLRRAAEAQQKRQQEMMEHMQVVRDAGIRRAREVITDYDTQMSGMDDYLAAYGFAPHEIQSVADPRMLQVIRDALQVRRVKEKSTSSRSELATKRKQSRPSRSVRSSRGKPQDSAQTRSRNAEKRARESGRTEDWADAIAERLGL